MGQSWDNLNKLTNLHTSCNRTCGRRRGAVVASTDNNNVVPFLCAHLLNLSYHSLFKRDNTNLPFREITIKAHVWENTLYFYVCQPVESGTGGR